MSSPAQRYAAATNRQRLATSHLGRFTVGLDFPLDDFQVRGVPGRRAGQGRPRGRPDRRRQDDRRRVRRVHGPGHRPQGLLHHADQGAVQPEVRRPRAPPRRRERRAADRRLLGQRRGAGGRHDHRGPAQHDVRRVAHPARPGLRGDGRGALPRRPLPRRGVGGGHHPPARGRRGGLAVGDREQRRGVRRLAGRGPRRHRGGRRGVPAGAAVAAHDGRPGHLRPVRRRDRDAGPLQRPGGAEGLGPGQPRAARRAAGLRARHRPARAPGGRRRPARPARQGAPGSPERGTAAARRPVRRRAQPCRRHRAARPRRACSRPSPSSSAAPAATAPSASCCPATCG